MFLFLYIGYVQLTMNIKKSLMLIGYLELLNYLCTYVYFYLLITCVLVRRLVITKKPILQMISQKNQKMYTIINDFFKIFHIFRENLFRTTSDSCPAPSKIYSKTLKIITPEVSTLSFFLT